MAAGENRLGTLRCSLRQPFTSLRSDISPPDNSADLSDAYSDSGDEFNESTRNVVQWLRSLPADHQWCEAEEQIGRPDSSEAVIDGISSIGDSDTPITLKSQVKPRTEPISVQKVSKNKKYRRGALHANSSVKEAGKTPKKRAKSVASKKSKKSSTSTEVTKITDNLEQQSDDTFRRENIECRPVFNNPEFGKMLDEAMLRTINKYKRSERTWEAAVNNEITIGAYEPPVKRSKAPN